MTSLASGHAVPLGLGKPPKWKLLCGSFRCIQLCLHFFSYFEVSHLRSCCVPFMDFLGRNRTGGKGEDFGRLLLGGIPVDVTSEQSQSLDAAILHRGCTLSKLHPLVIAPLKKNKKPREGSSKCMEQEGRWSENPV